MQMTDALAFHAYDILEYVKRKEIDLSYSDIEKFLDEHESKILEISKDAGWLYIERLLPIFAKKIKAERK